MDFQQSGHVKQQYMKRSVRLKKKIIERRFEL